MEQNIGTSVDGRLWIMKALDPAGQSVDVRGMPDVENHTCAVLNYQTQTQMTPPNLYKLDPSNNMTYDGDLYLFQHPLIFGAGVTFPSGTVDPLTYGKTIRVEFGGNLGFTGVEKSKGKTPSISFTTGGNPLFPRTPFVAYNEELGKSNIKDMVSIFQSVAQRHRVIYGGAQLVPTCSANDNSGSISVSQSFLNGDRSGSFFYEPAPLGPDYTVVSGDNDNYPLIFYEPGDFPSEKMIMQNPRALITRFYEGAYVPYKLPNPLETNFINTGQLCTTRTPGWITGAQISNDGIIWSTLSWNYDAQAFITPNDASGSPIMQSAVFIRIQYLTKTGQTGYLVFKDTSATNAANRNSFTATIDLTNEMLMEENRFGGFLNCNSKDVSIADVANGIVTADQKTSDGEFTTETVGECEMLQFPKAPIVAAHFSGLNFRGNIKVMIRVGVEIVCNPGSLYMPMVHISPPYDEAAIKNYIRVSHEMRDGYYGNAAAPEFKQSFMTHLLQVLWQPYVSVDFANRGGNWLGELRAVQPS